MSLHGGTEINKAIDSAFKAGANNILSKALKITLKEWDYTCGDGCCTDYGTQILIDGKEVVHYDEEQVVNAYVGCDVEVALRSVLKHLGFENIEVERVWDEED